MMSGVRVRVCESNVVVTRAAREQAFVGCHVALAMLLFVLLVPLVLHIQES